MEFLAVVVVLMLGAYVGYKYYQSIKPVEEPAVLDLPVEAAIDPVPVEEPEVKKERVKKAPSKKSAPKADVDGETTPKAAPKKKKPTMKVVK